jgi:hypothetical protein
MYISPVFSQASVSGTVISFRNQIKAMGEKLFDDLDDSTSLILQMLVVLAVSPVVGFVVAEYFGVGLETDLGAGAATTVLDAMVYYFFGSLVVVPVGFTYRLLRAEAT